MPSQLAKQSGAQCERKRAEQYRAFGQIEPHLREWRKNNRPQWACSAEQMFAGRIDQTMPVCEVLGIAVGHKWIVKRPVAVPGCQHQEKSTAPNQR